MSENDVEAFLLSVSSSMEADMIESLLKANDIPVLRKYRESGGYMMIMMGSTIYGVDLYVPGDMLDKAREIVDNSREASKDAAFPDNVNPEETIGEAPEEQDGADADTPEGTSENAARDTAGSEAWDVNAGDTCDRDNYARDTDAGEVEPHEEQYRLAEKHSDRRRRGRAWMTLLFFTLLILIITMLIKYLYGLFGAK